MPGNTYPPDLEPTTTTRIALRSRKLLYKCKPRLVNRSGLFDVDQCYIGENGAEHNFQARNVQTDSAIKPYPVITSLCNRVKLRLYVSILPPGTQLCFQAKM